MSATGGFVCGFASGHHVFQQLVPSELHGPQHRVLTDVWTDRFGHPVLLRQFQHRVMTTPLVGILRWAGKEFAFRVFRVRRQGVGRLDDVHVVRLTGEESEKVGRQVLVSACLVDPRRSGADLHVAIHVTREGADRKPRAFFELSQADQAPSAGDDHRVLPTHEHRHRVSAVPRFTGERGLFRSGRKQVIFVHPLVKPFEHLHVTLVIQSASSQCFVVDRQSQ